jgi:hypothetical protein
MDKRVEKPPKRREQALCQTLQAMVLRAARREAVPARRRSKQF